MKYPSKNTDTERLIESLQASAAWPESVAVTSDVELIETHISWVLLTDDFAWKIKKPVRFDFLDFSTLERRQHFCNEELHLNHRFAPELYLAVVAITGTPEQPVVVLHSSDSKESQFDEEAAPAIEFAVQMRRFDQSNLLSHLAEDGHLDESIVDELADTVASFHDTADRLSEKSARHVQLSEDTPDAIECLTEAVHDNFEALQQRLDKPAQKELLEHLENWTDFELDGLREALQFRQKNGMVRNVHGDLHLGNIAIVDEKVCLFDCIEFNEDFRWIDVMSEIAFIVMDLEGRGLPRLAWRFLNRYLERTGDYEGVRVLPFFLVYRAMIRAKVDAIRLENSTLPRADRRKLRDELESCLDTADVDHDFLPPALLLMHGVSGSGKSHVSQQLLETLPAVRVRSDVERKRLSGLALEDRPDSLQVTAIYSSEASQQTYQRLLYLADTLLLTGYPVIIDATFLSTESRQPFLKMAAAHCAKTMIVECTAPENVLRQRVSRRLVDNSDVSDADVEVLAQQLPIVDRPHDSEAANVVRIDTSEDDELSTAINSIRRLLTPPTAARTSLE